MTSFALNTPAANTNVLLSMPSTVSSNKKVEAKSSISYTFLPKNTSRKSTARLSSVDWDLNMNELEFE